MATGFVDRYKGKTTQSVGTMWVGGVQVNATGADMNTAVGWGSVPVTTSSTGVGDNSFTSARASGVDTFAPGAQTGGSIFRLPKPFAGANRIVYLSTVNGSTIMFVTVSTDGSVTVMGVGSTGSTATIGTGGSTLTTTMKSTQSCQIFLVGLSTSAWLFNGIMPSTTGHLVFSATT